ncbi:Bug family tripartite tricarboxylate transporter substrate binding protein [Acuticoccus mangrovi]|uniref:Tripartite tricarboxylate transporter substrate binding protein n=1 Tax=Acuticoccus mangrovi TaxID=2796142 RepID=A0A934MBV7_9HYPH|nr:tripartite tricarboxylate transporter substrate binding protein [Acuticoccus mangrovi]MBJ3774567.1 tripartite tricarboxylate transporter substrate binding protein [Acuticoccus mangrovi]
MRFKFKTSVAVLAASFALAAGPALAEYPERGITMIVGYSAGGGTDVMARTLAPFLEKYLGGNVSVTVENKPGAGGELGFTAIAEAKPDGYTIGMLNIPSFINPMIQRDPDYDIDSFAPIGNIVSDATSLVVRTDSEFETLEDFITYIKEHPGAVPVGNSSLGGATHTSFLRFLNPNDLEVTHVPFPGAAPSRTALLGGHVAASVMGIGEAAPLAAEGQLRILATMRKDRWSEAPDVPTFTELGYPIVAGSDRGLAAPAGIPDEARDKLAEAVAKIMDDPEFQEAARKQSLPLNYLAPDDYAAHMNDTYTQMKAIWDKNPWIEH